MFFSASIVATVRSAPRARTRHDRGHHRKTGKPISAQHARSCTSIRCVFRPRWYGAGTAGRTRLLPLGFDDRRCTRLRPSHAPSPRHGRSAGSARATHRCRQDARGAPSQTLSSTPLGGPTHSHPSWHVRQFDQLISTPLNSRRGGLQRYEAGGHPPTGT